MTRIVRSTGPRAALAASVGAVSGLILYRQLEVRLGRDRDSRALAWELFVEVATRVSTQPLGADEGLLREAMNSLYVLFGRARELLARSRPVGVINTESVEGLALAMLNQELRPFLSKWHPLLTRFEQSGETDESTWEHNAVVRSELDEMRGRLVEFALSFARLAGVTDPDTLLAAIKRRPA